MVDSEHVERLALLARNGDAAALNVLLGQVRLEVLRHCRRLLPHHQDAEEACQDALLAIAAAITGFEGRSRFRTWMHVVTANSARQAYRRLRQRAAERPTGELPVVADPRTTSVIAGTRLDLLDALDRLEHDRPDLVGPIVLRELAQLEYAEIAERLGLPIGTVKTHIHRGRQRLRELLRG
jgi:RNA polymerase sigma factor (sigma-70 family)